MFEPKENKYNIQSLEDIFKTLDKICKDEKKYSDEELSEKLGDVYDFCHGGETGGVFYFITHSKSRNLCKKRAKKYCKKNKIKLEDYKGILPYRMNLVEAIKN